MSMEIETINKLNEITNIIKSDKELIKYKKLRNDLLNDYNLLEKINKLKKIDIYGNKYLELKNEILSNKKYKNYIELEKKIYFDIKDINNRLNSLIEKSGCR